jgi:signal peptidase I
MLLLKNILGKSSLFIVKEGSMNPTLADGDLLLVRSAIKPLVRGSIVIANVPSESSETQVKRVVGLPKDRILFEDSLLFINDEYCPENYLAGLPQTVGLKRLEWRLGQDEYFLLGDNRSRSVDSRQYGPVGAEFIHAQVLVRLWPLRRGMRMGG